MATAEMYPRNDGRISEVIQNLFELFDGVLEKDMIQSVASSCDYNLEVTTNALIEMVNNVDNSDSEIKAEPGKPILQNGGFSYANAASSRKYLDNVKSQTTVDSKASSSNINLDPTKNILVKSQRRLKTEIEFDRIIQHIRQESRILILMRGLPGSGKSYLAKTIVDRSVGIPDYNTFILSTDEYFYNKRTGMYTFDPTMLGEAHEWNQHRAYKQMSAGVSPVIIDNTNTQMWEMKSYVMMAANFGYIVEIVEPFTPWAFDVKELHLRNSHNVSKAKINEMLLRYEKDITPTSIFATYNLSYVNLIPPIKRTFPQITSVSTITEPCNKSEVEEIDLIGFDEELNPPEVIYISDDSNDIKLSRPQNSNLNLIDGFVTDSKTNIADVLRPSTFPSMNQTLPTLHDQKQIDNVNKTSTKNPIKKPKDLYPTLNLSSWGLSEDAVSSWESWDLVTPLTKSNTFIKSPEVSVTETPKITETMDASTNTSSYDFSLLGTHCLSLITDSLKIIRATGRDINADSVLICPTTPPKRIILDKSSMTDEDFFNVDENTDVSVAGEHIQQLISLFPTIPIDYLRDVYEKCGKDINWAVDLLLDDTKEILTGFRQKSINKKIVADNLEFQEAVSEPIVYQAKHDSAEINKLKKHIEQKIEINSNFYSEHVRKIKNLKRNNDESVRLEQPCSSKASNFDVYPTNSGEVICVNTDVDFNEFEPDIDYPHSEEAEEQTVEINLGSVCINQLESLFGLPEIFPKGFLPIVQIPMELAEQLHAFYIQSVLVQVEAQNNVLEMITKEDEELARQLQRQEDVADDRKEIGLQEIMKEQAADKLNRKIVDEWKQLTPDTLAAKLTIQKLVNSFPSVEKTLLMEILHAHNNSYVQTVEVLLASTDANKVHDPDGDIREPPITDAVINDMRKARDEKVNDESAPNISKTANEYRDEANSYHKKHNEYMLKAQRAFQSRQYPVAQFYSDLAKSYTQLYEQTNSLAATAFLQEHSTRLQNFHTLDLHYLYVKEAIPALDIFLDTNINLISDSHKKSENLFIITGRGKRSFGKSRLKPVVIARLKKRGLQWVHLNPGLLKVKIHPYSATTNNVN
ncbi:hypothetical protein RN001_005724 [Aquatica leii]|uniref:NEDD4-binding protein 2 n=1 Tax=Aquatica leii TaxID=1421715 RepID=A0AAN7SS43_9COLE|nr:hypothetical protein RN001_005724 [Aquatica leii]